MFLFLVRYFLVFYHLSHFCRLSCGEGPLFAVADVSQHAMLFKEIEKVFPWMKVPEQEEVYCELLKCVERKNLVCPTLRKIMNPYFINDQNFMNENKVNFCLTVITKD